MGGRTYAPGSEIIQAGAYAQPIRRVDRGWVACSIMHPSGRRQVVRLVLPGELLMFGPGAVNCAAEALTEVAVTVCDVATDAVSMERAKLARDLAAIANRLNEAHLHAAVYRLGSLTALERTAHLIAEIAGRLSPSSVQSGVSIDWPLRQALLAEMLGLSTVHISRVMGALKAQRLIALRERRMWIPDLAELSALAEGSGPAGACRAPPRCRRDTGNSVPAMSQESFA